MLYQLDTRGTGKINWADFCNYFLMYYREKDYAESLKLLPFETLPKIKHCPHNQVNILDIF